MKKVLVSGGAGFIGSHLCTRLIRDGHKVICLDNLFTGSEKNIAHLKGNSRFELYIMMWNFLMRQRLMKFIIWPVLRLRCTISTMP